MSWSLALAGPSRIPVRFAAESWAYSGDDVKTAHPTATENNVIFDMECLSILTHRQRHPWPELNKITNTGYASRMPSQGVRSQTEQDLTFSTQFLIPATKS